MEVLFITHKFPPSIGGMQKQSYELINGMHRYCKIHTIIQSPTENKLWFFLNLRRRVKNMLRLHPGISVIHCNSCCFFYFVSRISTFQEAKDSKEKEKLIRKNHDKDISTTA